MLNILIFTTIGIMLMVIYLLTDVYKLMLKYKMEESESGSAVADKSEVDIAASVAPAGSEKQKNPAISFGIVVIAVSSFYTFFATSIPQIEWHPPEKVEIAANVSQEELIKIGKEIFEEKGQCLLCHDVGGGGLRAPDLQGIGGRAGERIEGYSTEDYLFESLYFPPVFVVEGYDPTMPPVNKPPASLSDQEMVAVVGYLQSMGGEVTVSAQTKPNFDKVGK